MNSNWKNYYWLGASGSDIFSLISPSKGLRNYAFHCIKEGATRENRNCIRIDAQLCISTPHLWSQFICSNSDTKVDPRSFKLTDSFNLLHNTVVCIDNVTDFLFLSRYPGNRDFILNFNNNAGNNNNCWILAWNSTLEIPENIINTDVYHLQPWNIDDLRYYLESRNINLPNPMIQTILDISDGCPEYIDSITDFTGNIRNPKHLIKSVKQSLSNQTSLLSTQCRLKWLEILHQARGYGSLKALLLTLAFYPDSRLSELAKQMANSPPAVKDYLQSLIKVGAISRNGWTYRLTDPMLASWLKMTSPINMDTGPYNQKIIHHSEKPSPQDTLDYTAKERIESDDSFLEFD